MANFQPIDMAIANPLPRFIHDPEWRRAPREYLLSISHHNGSHNYPYCWGYTIFRTVYSPGSDEAFAKAIERLNIYAKDFAYGDVLSKRLPNQKPRDPLPNQELWSRYYNEVIEDPTLADATVEEVGGRFDSWVSEHLNSDGGKRRYAPNTRFSLCIMLDQESIDNILAMPENPRTDCREDPLKMDRWVKVVTDMQWADRDEQRAQLGRIWLRVAIHDRLWSCWFGVQDPDFIWEYTEEWDENDPSGALNFWGNRPPRQLEY